MLRRHSVLLCSSAAVEFWINFTTIKRNFSCSALIRGLPWCFQLNDLRRLATTSFELQTFSVPSLRFCLLYFWPSDSLINLLIKRKFGYNEKTFHRGKFWKFHSPVFTKFSETLLQWKSKLWKKKKKKKKRIFFKKKKKFSLRL